MTTRGKTIFNKRRQLHCISSKGISSLLIPEVQKRMKHELPEKMTASVGTKKKR